MGYLDTARKTVHKLKNKDSGMNTRQQHTIQHNDNVHNELHTSPIRYLPTPYSSTNSLSTCAISAKSVLSLTARSVPEECAKSAKSVLSPPTRPEPAEECAKSAESVKRSTPPPRLSPAPLSNCDQSPWDPLVASLIRRWLTRQLDASWPVDWGYHAPAELCQRLRTDADAAFEAQDLAGVYQALAAFQEAVIPLFVQKHPKRRTAAFRHPWWPARSRCLLWKTQPEAPCPDCGSKRFWRADSRGFVCDTCCSPVACEPVERFTLTRITPDAAVPGKLIWWHKNQDPPTWRLKEYPSMNDPAPYPVQRRWPQLK